MTCWQDLIRRHFFFLAFVALASLQHVGVAQASETIQKAAFMVSAPGEPNNVKIFEGRVTWEEKFPNSVETHLPIIIANVSIPSAGLMITASFEKNPRFDKDPTIQSHFQFINSSKNDFGSVTKLRIIQMRGNDEGKGSDLSGTVYGTSSHDFQMDLNAGAANDSDLNLIATRNWLDIPVLLSSGVVGKLTFEKGAIGHQIFSDSLGKWDLSGNQHN